MSVRRFVPALLLIASLGASGMSAHAQKLTNLTTGTPIRLVGQITNLQGTPDSPSGFTLQLGIDTWDLKIPPQGIIKAQSAEADVEGLVNGDYALIDARRIKHVLYAYNILYDVQPLAPLRLFDGTVVRVSPDGRRITIRADQNKVFLIRVALDARYRIDGKVSDSVPVLLKGNTMQILARHNLAGWIGYDLDLRTGTFVSR